MIKMAKNNSIYRRHRRSEADKKSDASVVTRGAAESAVEQVYLCLNYATLETLVEDFNFTPDQLKRFTEICRIKFQKKRIELEHSFSTPS